MASSSAAVGALSSSSSAAAAAASSAPSPYASAGVGRVCMVTGASNGLGKVVARALAREGFHVFLACRSKTKTRTVIAEIKEETGNSKVEFLELDLASLASVRQCAETFLARQLPLHLLVNNAGVAQTGLTEDGFESQFGVNHLGHFLLTMLLLDRLKAAAPARIIILTSDMHWLAGSLDWEAVRRPCPRFGVTWGYCLSKLANLLFMDELVRRLEGTHVVVHAVHPGLVATDIIADKDPVTRWLVSFFAVSTDLAVHTILGPAMLPEYGEVTGLYFQGKRSMRPSSKACDPALAARLWKQSEIWTGLAPAAVDLDGGR